MTKPLDYESGPERDVTREVFGVEPQKGAATIRATEFCVGWPKHPKYPGVPFALYSGPVKLVLWRGRPLTLKNTGVKAFDNWMRRLMPDLTVIPAEDSHG